MAEILNKQRQASRVVLDGVVNDASAALRNGQQPQVMPSRNQLISTYGLVQGGQLYTQLQNDEAFGNNVKLVKKYPSGTTATIAGTGKARSWSKLCGAAQKIMINCNPPLAL